MTSSSPRLPFAWHNAASQQFLKKDYLLPGQTLQERVAVIANHAQHILQTNGNENLTDAAYVASVEANRLRYEGWAAKFTDYVSRGWFSLSTPIWTNFGTERGMGISCFGSYISDTIEGILWTQAEVGMLTKNGGGTSGYFGKLRPRGAKIKDNGTSNGAVHFMQLFETQTDVISQGSARRGQFAGYLDIDHPDIMEFLSIQTEGHPLQNISFGVCVATKWLDEMRAGDQAKRVVWARILERRLEKGYPYLFFSDNVNNGTSDVYKDKKLTIWASNLCTEIAEPTSEDETFVCDLASQNVLHFEEWEHTDATEVLLELLDAVMTDFIRQATPVMFMDRAVRFAKRHRAVGIGQLGYHHFLQSKMIPFEGMGAKMWNVRIAKNMKEAAYAASAKLAGYYGEPELLKGYGRRHTVLLAPAPTTSSAFILGQVSQSIEPLDSNYYIKDVAKIKHTIKNPYLTALLESKGLNVRATWESIAQRGGSVQHLDFLDRHEKDVFKTFAEISQMEIIIQAAQRQKFIDQSQSLNLKIDKNTSVKDLNQLILTAHDLGVKTLYYQHGVNAAQEFARELLACKSCE